MRSTFVSLSCGLALVATLEGGASAGNIVVFGDHAARADAQDRLNEAGHFVVIAGALPADLSSYDAVWHVGAATQFDDATRNRLSDFMKTGGGVFLSGEWACCETMNASIQQVVNRFVRQSASAPSPIQIGGLGSAAAGTQYFNPDALGGVTVAPNLLEYWRPGTTGMIRGVDGENVLTVDENGETTGAIWSGGDLTTGGQLVVMMDSDWYTRGGARDIARNLSTFLIEGAPEEPRDWTKPTVENRAGAATTDFAIGSIGHELDETGDGDELTDDDFAVGCSAGGAGGGLGLGMFGILGALALVNRRKRS